MPFFELITVNLCFGSAGCGGRIFCDFSLICNHFPIGSAGCGGRIFCDFSVLFRVVLHLAEFFYFSPIFLTNIIFRTGHGESSFEKRIRRVSGIFNRRGLKNIQN